MDVVCDVTGNIGELILNRPAALNAIDLPMVRALRAGLDAFVANADVHAIILRSAGEGAFCAGGDVRHLRSLVLRGEYDLVCDFFTEEYALNAAIAACPKPYVSFIDGICMGGGLGLSIHGRYRVVTERARLALPETAIGFFPDIGASFFLPRLSGASGLWLGLTGARLDTPQAIALGLATHYVPAVRLAALHTALFDSGEDIGPLLDSFAAPVAAGAFAPQRVEIDALFGAGALADIFAALRAAATPFANDALASLSQMSPNSLRVTADLLTAGRDASLETCLAAEHAAALVVTRHPDFAEGIRAMLVDKDRAPRWRNPNA